MSGASFIIVTKCVVGPLGLARHGAWFAVTRADKDAPTGKNAGRRTRN
jgi:hypothetical protein